MRKIAPEFSHVSEDPKQHEIAGPEKIKSSTVLTPEEWQQAFDSLQDKTRLPILEAIRSLGNNWVNGADINTYLTGRGLSPLMFAHTDFGIGNNFRRIGLAFELQTQKNGTPPTKAIHAKFQLVKFI